MENCSKNLVRRAELVCEALLLVRELWRAVDGREKERRTAGGGGRGLKELPGMDVVVCLCVRTVDGMRGLLRGEWNVGTIPVKKSVCKHRFPTKTQHIANKNDNVLQNYKIN